MSEMHSMHGSKSDGSFSVRIMKNIAPPSGTLGAPMPNVVHFFSPVFHIRPLYSSLWPSIVGLKSATKDESKSGGRHCETRDPCQTCLAVSRACACHAATDSCLHRNDSRLDSCCNRRVNGVTPSPGTYGDSYCGERLVRNQWPRHG